MEIKIDVRYFKKGERVDELSTAGEDFVQITDGNIKVDCFPVQIIKIPCLEANAPGSGNLDNLLKAIRKYFGCPLVFTNLVNAGLEEHLRNSGYSILSDCEPEMLKQ